MRRQRRSPLPPALWVASCFLCGAESLSMSADRRLVSKQLQRVAARVAYDGSGFRGSQLQPGKARTVQRELEAALGTALQRETRITAASRTDTGVHARGQAIHFDMPAAWARGRSSSSSSSSSDDEDDADGDDENARRCGLLENKVNKLLPDDVLVWNVSIAPPRSGLYDDGVELPWHAMIASRGKLYSYRWRCGLHMGPLDRKDRALWYKDDLDIDLLEACLPRFEGTHDFAAFANRLAHKQSLRESSGAEGPLDTRRTIKSIRLVREGGAGGGGVPAGCRDYRLDFELDGALYKMVRNVVGGLFDLARGELTLDEMDEIFAQRDRNLNPCRAAPAVGLTLEHVYYDAY